MRLSPSSCSQPQSWLSLLAPWMLESPSFSSSFGLVQRASSSTVSCFPSIVFDDRSVFKCSLLLMTDSIHSCIAAVFSSAGAFGSKLIDAINFLIHVISPTFQEQRGDGFVYALHEINCCQIATPFKLGVSLFMSMKRKHVCLFSIGYSSFNIRQFSTSVNHGQFIKCRAFNLLDALAYC